MEKGDTPSSLPVPPLPCLATVCHGLIPHGSIPRTPRNKERSKIHRDILQLYGSEELASIYQPTAFNLSIDKPGLSLADISFDEDRHEKKVHIINWAHDLDPDKPLNWPTWKKSLNIACIFTMCIISPFTSSVCAPAIPDLMLDFQTTNSYLSASVLSIYVLGYAIGPLVIAPLSELVGRVPLYHFCNALFSVCTLLCGQTTSAGGLVVARLFAGMGGSAVFALAPSSLADLLSVEHRAAAMALVAVAYNLGPSVSPTAGSYINDAWGWRWVFHISGGLGLCATALNFAVLRESYEPVLLRRKAARLRKHFGHAVVKSEFDFDDAKTRGAVLASAMLMPLRILVFSKTILLSSMLTAIAYGAMYVLYTTLPTTFLTVYDWPPKHVGLAYLGTAVGALAGMIAGAKISDAVVNHRKQSGDKRPENRLLPMCFFWPCVGGGLLVYAWTARKAIHWVAPLIGTSIFGAGAMSAIFFTGTYILDSYPVHSASGTAASTLFRSILGGLAPLFSKKLYEHLDVEWTFSLLAFVALAVAPVPWIAYRFGEEWRKNEGFEVEVRGEGRCSGVSGGEKVHSWSEVTRGENKYSV